jgi:hypothetical protein
MNVVQPEAIRLQLFPFSLRDRAGTWFHSLLDDSITTWNQLKQAFPDRFFSPKQKCSNKKSNHTFDLKLGGIFF